MDLQDFVERLKNKAIDHSEYFHYTTVDKYLKMQTPVELPNGGGKHRVLWLTPATKTNDGMERKYGEHVYLGCFTYSHYESVGMWFMYGHERQDAIRIGFDRQHLTQWRKANIVDSGHGRKIKAYGVSINADGSAAYEEIPVAQIDDVCLYDVAYVLSKAEIAHHDWPDNVEWHREYHRVTSNDSGIVSEKDGLLCSEDFTDNTCEKLPFCFKKKGWAHEREVRLVVRLRPEVRKWAHIAIPFDEPLESTRKKGHVVLGPWFKKGCCEGVFDEARASRSVFAGELSPDSCQGKTEVARKSKNDPRLLFVRINSWQDYYRVAGFFATSSESWVFRGHQDQTWKLETALQRARLGGTKPTGVVSQTKLPKIKLFQDYLDSTSQNVYEKEKHTIQMLKSMFQCAHYLGQEALPYVMVMQHYGIPTRLLDFTHSLLTALFFAFEHYDIAGERAIWAVRLSPIMDWAQKHCRIYTDSKHSIFNAFEVAEDVFVDDKHDFANKSGILPILDANNPRMQAQKGLFLMPLDGVDFMRNLWRAHNYTGYSMHHCGNTPTIDVETYLAQADSTRLGIVKFIFAEELRSSVAKVFLQNNMCRANLFPDSLEDLRMFSRIKEVIDLRLENGLL